MAAVGIVQPITAPVLNHLIVVIAVVVVLQILVRVQQQLLDARVVLIMKPIGRRRLIMVAPVAQGLVVRRIALAVRVPLALSAVAVAQRVVINFFI